MKNVDQYLFTNFIAVQEGVYLAHRELFWTFLAGGHTIETGICDWWYDVAEFYPNHAIVFHPVDTTQEHIEIGPDTIYRGVHELDDDPEMLCYYAVIGE